MDAAHKIVRTVATKRYMTPISNVRNRLCREATLQRRRMGTRGRQGALGPWANDSCRLAMASSKRFVLGEGEAELGRRLSILKKQPGSAIVTTKRLVWTPNSSDESKYLTLPFSLLRRS